MNPQPASATTNYSRLTGTLITYRLKMAHGPAASSLSIESSEVFSMPSFWEAAKNVFYCEEVLDLWGKRTLIGSSYGLQGSFVKYFKRIKDLPVETMDAEAARTWEAYKKKGTEKPEQERCQTGKMKVMEMLEKKQKAAEELAAKAAKAANRRAAARAAPRKEVKGKTKKRKAEEARAAAADEELAAVRQQLAEAEERTAALRLQLEAAQAQAQAVEACVAAAKAHMPIGRKRMKVVMQE